MNIITKIRTVGVATKITGKLLFISGQINDENGELIKGKVGKDLIQKMVKKLRKDVCLSIVAQAKKALDG